MITKFKIFETIYHRPKPMEVGDYVLALDVDFSDVAISDETVVINYLKNHVGEIVGIAPIMVKYNIDDEYILKVIKEQFHVNDKHVNNKNAIIELRSSEIPIWSDNKKELEMTIQLNKYNL